MDSQSVSIAATKGPKGMDANKKVKGHKRHIVPDKFELILGVLINKASMHDGVVGAALLGIAVAMYPTLKFVTGDGLYTCEAVSEKYGLKYEERKREEGEKKFIQLPLRWPVERTFGWRMWSRQLSKGYDHTERSLKGWVDLAMSHICLRRLFQGKLAFAR
ncbi:MAG: transposase [Myxococcales bacterium]|nr:transposase [Polyangiaceae bacterium]MDW8251826.1 transposase [Myxococcales bacterium]